MTTLIDEKVVAQPINAVFDGLLAVGDTDRRGTYLSAKAATGAAGQPVRTLVPVAQGAGVRLDQAVARLVEYTPYRRIVIAQESPWESRTEILLTSLGSRTRVSTRTTVPLDTVEQVADMLDTDTNEDTHANGEDRETPERITGTLRIALVTSLTGHSGLFGRSTVNCARLAERRINAEGGMLGRPVEVVVIDDASSAERGVTQLLLTDGRHGIEAAVGVHSSEIATAVDASGWAERKPYLYAPLSESSLPQRSLIAVGDTEQDQLTAAIPHLHRLHGAGARWALVGSDFSWPRAVNRQARELIEALGGEVVREVYADAETPDTDELAREVLAEHPDVVISSLVGWGMIDFEEAMFRAGARRDVSSLSLLLDECSRELLGEAAEGMLSATSYLPALDTQENRDFVRDYVEAFGAYAPPISALGEATYEALLLLAHSVNAAGSTDPGVVREHLGRSQLVGPRGVLSVGANGRLRAPMYLARATADSWEFVATE
ncbi:MAG: ABC transporter substrate-binding protein [Leucobacter sp.]